MINIENPDSLRIWLSNTLAPICDADPAALAKYVMALLKKDKSELDLKEFCVEQLDVFLQKETKLFVDKLFAVIKDRSYLSASSKPTSSVVPESSPAAAVSSTSGHKTSPIGSTTDSPSSARGSDRGGAGGLPRSESGGGRPGRSNSRSGRKRSPSPVGHRSSDHRSRSRSKDRTTGNASSRSSGGDRRYEQRQPAKEQPRRDPDKENRSSRSRKSPAQVSTPSSTSAAAPASATQPEGWPDLGRNKASASRKGERGDSDGSVDDDKPEKKRKKLRCRDFDEKGFCMRGDLCPYDHGPDPVVVDDIALPTMISMTGGGSAAKPPSTPGGTPNFSVPPPGYGTGPPGVHPPPPGMDTVPSYQQAEGYNPEAPSISVAVPPPGYNRPPPPAAVGSSGAPRHPPPIWTQQPPPALYLQPPTMGSAAPGTQLPPLPVPLPNTMMVQRPGAPAGRDLISLADAPDGVAPRTVLATPMSSTIPFRPGLGKRPFGGPGGLGMQPGIRGVVPYDKNNCTLEVRRIPSHLNTISKLNEHFSQFGQVVNMQVRYENDPEAALVTYANRQQAVSAYKSTAPILNNRFIKIFWHDKESAAEAGASGTGNPSAPTGKPSIKDRLGAPPNIQGHQAGFSGDAMKYRAPQPSLDEDGNHRAVVLSTSGNLTRTIYNPEALAAATSQKAAEKSGNGSEPNTPPSPSATGQKPGFPQQKSQPPPMVHPKKRKQQQLQEAMKKSLELQKAKADLVRKQVEQQKLLLVQLEKCTNPAQKKEILKTIKLLEKTIKTMTEDLAKAAKQATVPTAKSKETLEKEMLDTELELIRQKQSGGDTSELQRRLTELRLELTACLARSLSASSGMDQKSLATSAPVQSIGGQPIRKRRAMPETAVLDKRPRDLAISGFQVDEKDALIEHLQHYGMLEDIEFHHTKGDHLACRATVIYKTRREAETALANGAEFRNRQLNIQWPHQRTASISDMASAGVATGANADNAPNTEMTAEEMLASLDDDEDEEEDDGDRDRDEDDEDGEEEGGEDDDDEPSTGGEGGDWKRAPQ